MKAGHGLIFSTYPHHIYTIPKRQCYQLASELKTFLFFSLFFHDFPGKFEEDIIDICFEILNKSLYFLKNPSKDYSQRNDVVYICRVVSAMVRPEASPAPPQRPQHGHFGNSSVCPI